MPPPVDAIPIAQKTRALGRGVQLLGMPKNEERSPGTSKRKTLQERQNTKALKLKIHKVAKMHMGPVDIAHTKELAKLMSTMVLLQRLKIRDDDMPAENPDKAKTDAPAPSLNLVNPNYNTHRYQRESFLINTYVYII